MSNRIVPLLLSILLTGACAGSGEHQSSVGNRNVLSRDQIMDTRAVNLYDAVQQLRSQWLRSQGAVTVRQPGGAGPLADNPETLGAVVRVFLNEQQIGGVETLRGIEPAAVQFIQYYRPAEAASRWGRQVGSAPVIYVSTRAGDS